MTRNIIVGGGIIGLSIAFEIAKRGGKVVILEKGQFGKQASWAGAGILTPANSETAIHPLEHLEALSNEIHEQWSAELKQKTGIENGFRKCGGLYLARTAGEVAALAGMVEEWDVRQIAHETIDINRLPASFQAIFDSGLAVPKPLKAIWVPSESQFSNRHHLKALVEACKKLGVQLLNEVGEVQVSFVEGRVESVKASGQAFRGDNYLFSAGPWTEKLIEPMNIALPMQPVRGQIVLYRINPGVASTQDWPIINEGSRYLVPRSDGHVLAGATIEEVGFNCLTTESEISNLRAWAESLCPLLNELTFAKAWAGLRPGTYDGFPYLGRLGEIENAFVATGHFKCGLQTSTGTAVVMADLMDGKTPSIDLRPFSPNRIANHQSIDTR